MAMKRESKSGGGKMRGRLFFIVVAVILAAVGLFFFLKPRKPAPPPPPPEEIIRRKFRSSFNPEESTLARMSSLNRELAADKRISRDTRRQALVESLAVTKAETQLGKTLAKKMNVHEPSMIASRL